MIRHNSAPRPPGEKKKSRLLLAAAPVFIFALIASGRALPTEGHHEHPRERFSRRLAHMKIALQLSEEQMTKLQNIVLPEKKRGYKAWADFRKARVEMRKLVFQDKVDKAAVERKINQIAQIVVQILRQETALNFKIREILTPEQWRKANKYLGGFL